MSFLTFHSKGELGIVRSHYLRNNAFQSLSIARTKLFYSTALEILVGGMDCVGFRSRNLYLFHSIVIPYHYSINKTILKTKYAVKSWTQSRLKRKNTSTLNYRFFDHYWTSSCMFHGLFIVSIPDFSSNFWTANRLGNFRWRISQGSLHEREELMVSRAVVWPEERSIMSFAIDLAGGMPLTVNMSIECEGSFSSSTSEGVVRSDRNNEF